MSAPLRSDSENSSNVRSGLILQNGVFEEGIGMLEGANNTGSEPMTGNDSLKWWLPLHIYAFACIFFILALYSFISGLNIRSQITRTPFMTTANALLCGMGLSRACILVLEQYNNSQVFPQAISHLLWDVAFPCLLSAFIIVQFTFLELSQMDFGPKILRHRSFMVVAICTHFSVVTISDVILGIDRNWTMLLPIVHSVEGVWALMINAMFVYIAVKVRKMLNTVPGTALLPPCIGTDTKGIMQLALLARCSNIATSVIGSNQKTQQPELPPEAQPEVQPETQPEVQPEVSVDAASQARKVSTADLSSRPPQISITDENELTVCYQQDSVAGSNSGGDAASSSFRIGSGHGKLHRPPASNAKAGTVTGDSSTRFSESANEISGTENMTKSSSTAEKSTRAKSTASSRAPRENKNVKHSTVTKSSNTTDNSLVMPKSSRDFMSPTDLTLQSVLNHIAFADPACSFKLSPKYQVKRVLRVACVAAVLGVLLSLLHLFQQLWQVGEQLLVLWSPAAPPGASPSSVSSMTTPLWASLQTLCRGLEFLIGCCIANVTKLPRPRSAGNNGLLWPYR